MLSKFKKSNPLLQKKEWRFFSRFRYVNYIIFLLFLFGLLYSVSRFYQIILTTISNASRVSELSETLRVEAIHFSKLEQVEEKWKVKYQTPLPEKSKDPFAQRNIFFYASPPEPAVIINSNTTTTKEEYLQSEEASTESIPEPTPPVSPEPLPESPVQQSI
ncbi:hypothetical protein H6758_02790 [Candidatus Nomurabacteria bacterium]|nr:hypothetical protein [Candidatus Nomurabacteria bacterium]